MLVKSALQLIIRRQENFENSFNKYYTSDVLKFDEQRLDLEVAQRLSEAPTVVQSVEECLDECCDQGYLQS